MNERMIEYFGIVPKIFNHSLIQNSMISLGPFQRKNRNLR